MALTDLFQSNRPDVRSDTDAGAAKLGIWARLVGSACRLCTVQSPDAAEIRLRQIGTLARQTPVLAGANLFNSAATALLFWDLAPKVFLLAWVGFVWASALARLRRWYGRRHRPKPTAVSERAVYRATGWAILSGLLWGIAAFTLFPYGSDAHQVFLAFVCGGMSAGAVASMSCLPAACQGFVLCSITPLFFRLIAQGDAMALVMTAMLVIYTVALVVLSQNGYESFLSSIRMTRDNEQLLADASTSHARLVNAIESLSDGFVYFGPDGRLVACNQRFREMWTDLRDRIVPGVHYRELIKAAAESVVVPKSKTRWMRDRIAHMKAPQAPFEIEHKDGRWLRIDDRRTSEGGIVSVHTDITTQKRNEHSLRRAKQKAELADRAKSEFLANMSHELRTPLNAIIGFSEIMGSAAAGAPDPDQTREYAADIHQSGIRLLTVIDDILNLAKIEAGRVDLQEQELDVAPLVESLVLIVSERAERAEVSLEVDLDHDLPILYGDGRSLKQILLNLLSNAIKFTPGGGSVVVGARRALNGGLSLIVTDTGIGMDDCDVPTALDSFGQVEPSVSKSAEGTGLGLPLAKSLIELHGGTLDIVSAPGEGTTVTVTMPPERVIDVDPTESAELG